MLGMREKETLNKSILSFRRKFGGIYVIVGLENMVNRHLQLVAYFQCILNSVHWIVYYFHVRDHLIDHVTHWITNNDLRYDLKCEYNVNVKFTNVDIMNDVNIVNWNLNSSIILFLSMQFDFRWFKCRVRL